MSQQLQNSFDGTVYLAADHAGFAHKEFIKRQCEAAGIRVEDFGAQTLDPVDDYPDFVAPLARAVSAHPAARGILCAKSGQGEAMCANRVRGVRAAVYYGGPTDILVLSREHNDANVLSIGADFVDRDVLWDAVMLWLNTPFTGEARHVRRIQKLDD